MPSLTIPLKELGRELRRLPHRDKSAVLRGLAVTGKVDAERWIQWSIRGGGAPSSESSPPRSSKQRKRRSATKKLIAKLKKLLRLSKAPAVKNAKPPKQCEGKMVSGYRAPIDTGDYARSWRTRVTESSVEVWSEANPPVKAGVIEEGRRAAPIPIGPLAEWVRRKFNCDDPVKAKSIAIAISKAASRKKRAGLHVLARAHPKIAEVALRNIKKELRKAKPGT